MKLLKQVYRFSHTLQTRIEYNKYQREAIFNALKNQQNKARYPGVYNKQGLQHYKEKNDHQAYKAFISQPQLEISSIGVGTYKGSLDETDDLSMFNGLVDSLDFGCNVIDSCRNFRGGRSQLVIGLALRHMIQQLGYSRNNFFLCSKAGYVRNNLPEKVQQFQVINDHCIHPLFLECQLQKSLQNMGVNTLDVYYLNNYAQSQMTSLQNHQFEQRLLRAFQFLEGARQKKKIQYYGLSSWQSFRLAKGQSGHVDLEKICKLAQKIGGKQHGFKFIQLPINILMPEVFAQKYIENKSFLDVAQQLKMNVISNSPLLSGSLINIPIPASLLKCNYNGAKHLQLIRSIPSKSLVSTLIGHKLNRHVKKNLQASTVPLLNESQWLNIFVPNSQQREIQLQSRQEL